MSTNSGFVLKVAQKKVNFLRENGKLKEKKAGISAEKAIDILKTIYGITIKLPQSKKHKLCF